MLEGIPMSAGLLPLYLSPSGGLVEAGRIKGRQATRLNISSAPVPSEASAAQGHHLVPVEVGDNLKAAPGLVLVLERDGPRVVHETQFLAEYALVKPVTLHDRANPR